MNKYYRSVGRAGRNNQDKLTNKKMTEPTETTIEIPNIEDPPIPSPETKTIDTKEIKVLPNFESQSNTNEDTAWQTLPSPSPLHSPSSSKSSNRSVRAYYKSQNNLIHSFVKHMEDESRSSSNLNDDNLNRSAQVVNDNIWIGRAITISFLINVILFIVKVIAAVSTGSLSVIASAVDSCLDLLGK